MFNVLSSSFFSSSLAHDGQGKDILDKLIKFKIILLMEKLISLEILRLEDQFFLFRRIDCILAKNFTPISIFYNIDNWVQNKEYTKINFLRIK